MQELLFQGVEGPRGPPGSRGPSGEGYPGSKARVLFPSCNKHSRQIALGPG